MNKEELYRVPVPPATSTYSPVSHRNVIEHIYEELDRHNLVARNEMFIPGRFGQQLVGYMDIDTDDNELGMRLAFRNSYDKSMSVAFVAGSSVWICGNGMISGEFNFLRKHTGSVNTELSEKINITLNELENHYNRMKDHASIMKSIDMNKRASAELIGRMFIEEDIITSSQLNIIKKEIDNPQFIDFEDPTLWSLYNHITYSLKEAHPTNYINQHKKLHEFVTNDFGLNNI